LGQARAVGEVYSETCFRVSGLSGKFARINYLRLVSLGGVRVRWMDSVLYLSMRGEFYTQWNDRSRMTWAILIPTTPDREPLLQRLTKELHRQINELEAQESVRILVFEDNGEITTGAKRNALVDRAAKKGFDYVSQFDSDDMPFPTYIKSNLEGISKGIDVNSLTGIITEDGLNPKQFIHSMRYDSWFEKDGVYYRNNNHLNVIKTEIAKRVLYPNETIGEDHSYSKRLLQSGLIKTEYWIDEPIYQYLHTSKK